MAENKNLLLAILLSIMIMVGFEYFFAKPKAPPQQPETAQPAVPAAPQANTAQPGAPAAPAAQPVKPDPLAQRAKAMEGARIRIETPHLKGSISLKGARIDDLTLIGYREEAKPDSAEIVLFSPPGSLHPYYGEVGWVAATGTNAPVPGADTLWTADKDKLLPDQAVTLTWDNGQGIKFQRRIALDKDYLFTITDRAENLQGETASLFPYALVSRTGLPKTEGFYILHEGPVGVLDGTLKEFTYKDLDDKGTVQLKSQGGWLGITDKYWLAAVFPDQKEKVEARFIHRRTDNLDKYQADYLSQPRTVAAGSAAEATHHIFAGAKKLALLDGYGEKLAVQRFDLAIDFGWFYFLTKPLFYLVKWFFDQFGNFGLAILALTVVVKLALFPLANKSYKAMSKMKKLQPDMQKLQQRFADDRQRMNQELMALYKREKVNPMAGCLPIIIQIPVFFALYKVLFVTIEMRHAPFYGWINDLSAPDPTTIFNLFGLIPWNPPAFLMIGIWPLIMGATMWLQQRLNPQPTDPVQAKVFMFLPILFTFLLASFPAGLVIYWAWSNVLSILQQWVIMRQMGVKA